MHLHHPVNDEEVVLLYPPVIGKPRDKGPYAHVRRLDVHGRLGRPPEPLELVDLGAPDAPLGEGAARWLRPPFAAVDGLPRAQLHSSH